MKAIIVAALLALSFTTGFTCSKNQPAEPSTTTTTTTQDEMAAPVATPADGAVATPADGAAATPAAEATPAATPAH
jgi:hypothetical protein